jgi:hypothetical protein
MARAGSRSRLPGGLNTDVVHILEKHKIFNGSF